MSYLFDLSIQECVYLVLYVISFGMYIRFGFRLADYVCREFSWFLFLLKVHFQKH